MKYFFLLLFGLFSQLANAQVFHKAPKSSQGKVHTITEWVRPNLATKAVKNGVSTFDKNGNLIRHQFVPFSPATETVYTYDQKNRMVSRKEGEERKSRFTYKPRTQTEETTFRGKSYRTIKYYDNKKKLIEKKTYSKGLELGNKYVLKERVLYHYNKKDSLSGEKIYEYNLLGNGQYDTRKCTYHYHPNQGYLIKKVYYDIDNTAHLAIDYNYYPDRKPKTQLYHYLLEDRIQIVEFLYQKNHLWQKITYENKFKHIEIYTEGRLIRLRSYLDNKIYRVIDYEWKYY